MALRTAGEEKKELKKKSLTHIHFENSLPHTHPRLVFLSNLNNKYLGFIP
jgi:hypothetical protein